MFVFRTRLILREHVLQVGTRSVWPHRTAPALPIPCDNRNLPLFTIARQWHYRGTRSRRLAERLP